MTGSLWLCGYVFIIHEREVVCVILLLFNNTKAVFGMKQSKNYKCLIKN